MKFLNFLFPILTSSAGLSNQTEKLQNSENSYSEVFHKYRKIFSEKTLLKDLNSKASLRIPINLFVFENYYKQVSQYYYHENYFYNDKLFVFDQNQIYDLHNLKNKISTFWLNNLLASKRYIYHGSEYKSEHAIKEHIDWVDGNSDLSSKLSEILQFNFYDKNSEIFSPQRKKIFLKYDFPHSKRVNLYSNYLIKNPISPKLNFFKDINYGRLKNSPVSWDKFFISNSLEDSKSKNSCGDLRNAPLQNIKNFEFKLEGYDSVCDGFYLKNFFKNDINYSTPFVGYREKSPNYWSKEYYFYNLGNYSPNISYSDDLNSDSSPESIWNINYENLFSIEKVFLPKNLPTKKLKINLNLSKIKNIENFLKISSAFDFELLFSANNKSKKIIFNLDDVFSKKEFELDDISESSLFSNFLLKVTENKNFLSEIKLISGNKNSFTYSVNIDKLLEKDLISEKLIFEEPKIKNIFPFEFENLEKVLECFFLTGKKNKQVLSSNFDLEKLNLRVKADSSEGIVNIKYFDFLENIEKEANISDLLTYFDFFEERIFSTKTEAKNFLKDKYIGKSNNFFWDHIEFIPENFNAFNNMNIFKLKFLFQNNEISNLWNNFFKNTKIKIKNHKNYSLTPIFKNFNKPADKYDEDLIKNELFSFPAELDEKFLNKTDYLFNFFVDNKTESLIVAVKLISNLNSEKNGEKEYIFKKYFSQNESKIDKNIDINNQKEKKYKDYYDNKEEEKLVVTKYGFIILVSILGTSGLVLGSLQLLNYLKYKSIL